MWQRTQTDVNESIIALAMEDLLAQNDMLYQRETELLSETQLNFLKALASGVEDGFSKKETIQKYRLGSSANISKIKTALIEKELIDNPGKTIVFLDPVYELWFVKKVLKR